MQKRGQGTTASEGAGVEGQPSFKLFGDVEPLALNGSGPVGSGPVDGSGDLEDRRKSFKLFGDVEPLALSTSGLGSGPVGGSSDLQGQRSFRLFGDVEPLALSTSGAIDGMAADGAGSGGEDRAAPGGDSSKPELEPEQSFRLFGPGGISPLRLRCGQHSCLFVPLGCRCCQCCLCIPACRDVCFGALWGRPFIQRV